MWRRNNWKKRALDWENHPPEVGTATSNVSEDFGTRHAEVTTDYAETRQTKVNVGLAKKTV